MSSLLLDSVDYVWSRIRGPRAAHDYTSRGLGPWPLDVRDREWYGSADLALAATDQARRVLRQGLGALGQAGFWRPLGPEWDEYAADPWAGLVVHLQDEHAHHGAEIALLRDLYLRRRN